jgi:hypothetical protein
MHEAPPGQHPVADPLPPFDCPRRIDLSGLRGVHAFINHIDSFTAFLLSRNGDVVATKIPPGQIADGQRLAQEPRK